MSKILNVIYNKSVEKGDKIIDDLFHKVMEEKLATPTNTHTWSRINVKCTLYFSDGNKIQIDNLENNRPNHTHTFLENIERVSYCSYFNLEFLPQYNDTSQGTNIITETDMDRFKELVKQWAKEWGVTTMNITKHGRNGIIYVFAHNETKRVDIGQAIKKMNERKYISNITEFEGKINESSSDVVNKIKTYVNNLHKVDSSYTNEMNVILQRFAHCIDNENFKEKDRLSNEYHTLYEKKVIETEGYKDIDSNILVNMISQMLAKLMKFHKDFIYREVVIPHIGKPYDEDDRYFRLIHAFVPSNKGWYVEGSFYNKKTFLKNLNKHELCCIFLDLYNDEKVIGLLNYNNFKKMNESNTFSEDKEVWKNSPIKGYESYKISSFGRVKNKSGNIINPFIKKVGNKISVVISLQNGSNRKRILLPQLVAKTFLDGNGSVIHKDGDKLNNKLSNLEYTDNPSKYSNKFFDRPSGEDAHDSFKIKQYDLNGNLINTYGSIGEASRETGIPTTNISKVAKGKRNSAGGYIWEYEIGKKSYKGVDPKIIKQLRDYYSENDVTIGDVWREFNITSDPYGTSRIIKSFVYKTKEYLSDRARDIIESLEGESDENIKKIMKNKYRYYITDSMLE